MDHIDTDSDTLEALKIFAQSEGRICPLHIHWAEFWRQFKELQRLSNNAQPPDELKSLILNGWLVSDAVKRERFLLQLDYIYKHGRIAWASNHLRELDESHWYHS